MTWWSKFWRTGSDSRDERLLQVRLSLQGWHDEGIRGDMRGWRDDQGDFLSLVIPNQPLGLPQLSDEVALQQIFRRLAENRGAGLIEVRVSTGQLGSTVSVIYKRLLMPSYAYTGMLFAAGAEPPQVWTIVAEERGTTGLREATITTELFNAGSMTIQDHERSWAKDPYDSEYDGVDRSVLRFVSDDESYDERFPQHPLTKVRRILAVLPSSINLTPAGEKSGSS